MWGEKQRSTHFLIGFKTDNFVILASDKTAFNHGSAFCISNDENKNIKLGEKMFMSSISKGSDINRFNEMVQNNLRLNKFRYGYELGPSATHNWLRQTIADSLRSEDKWKIDLIIGGYDVKDGKPWLSNITHTGSEFRNHNYYVLGSAYRLTMDRIFSPGNTTYSPDMPIEEALNIIKLCIRESQKHPISLSSNNNNTDDNIIAIGHDGNQDQHSKTNSITFNVVVIDKNGARQEDITV